MQHCLRPCLPYSWSSCQSCWLRAGRLAEGVRGLGSLSELCLVDDACGRFNDELRVTGQDTLKTGLELQKHKAARKNINAATVVSSLIIISWCITPGYPAPKKSQPPDKRLINLVLIVHACVSTCVAQLISQCRDLTSLMVTAKQQIEVRTSTPNTPTHTHHAHVRRIPLPPPARLVRTSSPSSSRPASWSSRRVRDPLHSPWRAQDNRVYPALRTVDLISQQLGSAYDQPFVQRVKAWLPELATQVRPRALASRSRNTHWLT
jgi:hypothetical protein